MIGRNDPCPCGSGKKYKKCCAGKHEVDSEQLMDNELDRIVQSYYYSALGQPAELYEFEQYKRKWESTLGDKMDSDEIMNMLLEFYIFVVRRDLWKRFLLKELNGTLRSGIRTVLQDWQNVFVLLGKVVEVQESYFVVEELLGHGTYQVERFDDMQVDKDLLVLGIVFSDRRKGEQGVSFNSGVVLFEDRNGKFIEKIQKMAEQSKAETSHEFFKEHLLTIYEALHFQDDSENLDEFAAEKLTAAEYEVLTILEQQLNPYALHDEITQFAKMVAVTYLLKEKVVFRKPEVIAAAVFKVFEEMNLLIRMFTQAEIAKLFQVSTSSMMKHVDRIFDIMDTVMEEMDQQSDNGPSFHYWIGIDPRVTERVNWEMYCKMESQHFDTMEEAQTFMSNSINLPFQPETREQQAQMYAYDAYEASSLKERKRLYEKAKAIDPNNVDVLLLQAQFSETPEEAAQYFEKAIVIGESQFDAEPEVAWGLVTNRPYLRALFAYGVWLYENENYLEASEYLLKLLELNPEDHQSARYLAVSALYYADELVEALRLLDKYKASSEDQAAFWFLKWAVQFDLDRDLEGNAELFIKANMLNSHVLQLMENEEDDWHYPLQRSITPGSMEEAQYIISLI